MEINTSIDSIESQNTDNNLGVIVSFSPGKSTDSEISSILARQNIGITAEHARKLQQVAAENNVIFGIRPVEIIASTIIKEGYPTKNFYIKGKSANWGPQAAFICCDQRLSKLEQNTVKADKFSQKVTESVTEKHAISGNLVISGNRIEELASLLPGKFDSIEDENGRITITAIAPSGQEYQFEAVKENEAEGKSSYTIFQDDRPLKVLCEPKTGKPITTDYDLMSIAPEWRNFGGQDMRPLPAPDYESFQSLVSHEYKEKMRQQKTSSQSDSGAARKSSSGSNTSFEHTRQPSKLIRDRQLALEKQNKTALQIHEINRSTFLSYEDEHKGNITARGNQLIHAINKKLDRGEGLEMVHHSDDAGSPFSDIQANFNATYFLPAKIGQYDEICILESMDHLETLAEIAEQKGYRMHIPEKWLQKNAPTKMSKKAQQLAALAKSAPGVFASPSSRLHTPVPLLHRKVDVPNSPPGLL